MDRTSFFAAARPLFGGQLKTPQVAGTELILDEWARRGWNDPRWLAYMLATTQHETASTMQAIREYGLGRGRSYGAPDPVTGQTYYGRGLVQLTWKENYARAGARLGIDLVNQPDQALVPTHAVRIMFEGMSEGWFARDKKGPHTLRRYFDGAFGDPVGARRIINGIDRAAQIAKLHDGWLAAIRAGVRGA